MNHRRRRAVRFEQLLWLSTQPGEPALVSYLINTSLPKSGLPACISSRITTVIQVVRYHQINHNWFNEPFAVSQYKSLILRHAWLNLWDKHMTTGRINQVKISCRLPPWRWQIPQSRSLSSQVLVRLFTLTSAIQGHTLHVVKVKITHEKWMNSAHASRN